MKRRMLTSFLTVMLFLGISTLFLARALTLTEVESGEEWFYSQDISQSGNDVSPHDVTLSDVENANSCTVHFDANGGSVYPDSKTVKVGSNYGELPIPTYDGYTFNGWYTDVNGGALVASSTIANRTSDHTLYAHWIYNNKISLDKTSLALNVGNQEQLTATLRNYVYGEDVQWYSSDPTVAEINGQSSYYSYLGGYYDYSKKYYRTNVLAKAVGTAIIYAKASGIEVSCTVTVYPSTYMLYFNANGGSVAISSKAVEYGEKYGALPIPTRKGYRFEGWYTLPSGGERITGDTSVSITDNQFLYAHWISTAVTGVTLDKTTTSLTVGESFDLTATVSPADATDPSVSWKSSDTSVATVANGVVTAVAPGTATITVTTADGGKTASCVVTVSEPIAEDKPTVRVSSVTGRAGETVDVTVELENNPGIAVIGFDVNYDTNALALKAITAGNIFADTEVDGNLEKVPFTFNAYTGKANKTDSGILVTLQFEIKENCEEKTYPIEVTAVEALNIDEEDVLFAVSSGAVTVRNVIPGDVNGDGKVARSDLLRLAKYFAGHSVEIDQAAADVTGDGKIARADLLRLAKYFAGHSVVLEK